MKGMYSSNIACAEGGDSGPAVIEGEERHDDQRRPKSGDLALMMLPECVRQQRQERDREEDAEEGQRPGKCELGAVQVGGMGCAWEENRERRDKRAEAPAFSLSLAGGVDANLRRGRNSNGAIISFRSIRRVGDHHWATIDYP